MTSLLSKPCYETVFKFFIYVFAFLLSILSVFTQLHAQELSGTYRGLDGASGITIQLARGGNGYVGQISSGSGGGTALTAEEIPGGARGPLTLQGQPGVVELLFRPVGLSMLWRPNSGGAELVYAFRREQLALPTPPAGFQQPPPQGATRVNPIDFLNSYEFWEAAQVARAYDGLDDKFRVIMKSWAVVHTDMLWKLCRAPVAPEQLTDALRGQGVTCSQVQQKIKESQATGAFVNFKREVQREKADVLRAVECARGINTSSVCTRAAQRTQQAALSLETVGSVLRRF